MIEYITLNWQPLLIGFGCALLYLIFNELEDESVRNNFKKNKQFFNSNLSWKNKWYWNQFDERVPLKKSWKYLWLFTPKYKERFYLSSTMFVFVTDGEHIFQFFKNRFITLIGFAFGWQLFIAIQLGLWVGSWIVTGKQT